MNLSLEAHDNEHCRLVMRVINEIEEVGVDIEYDNDNKMNVSPDWNDSHELISYDIESIYCRSHDVFLEWDDE